MIVTKRTILATLGKSELLDIGRRSELEVNGKMTKDDLLDRIAPATRVDLARILPALAYESLKAACKDLELPVDGREKAVFVARLLTAVTPPGHAVPQPTARTPDDFTLEISVEPRKPRLAWQGIDRKEAVVSVPTQVVEIIRPGRARDFGDSLLNLSADTRVANQREANELPPNRLIWTNDNLVALQTLLDERDSKTKDYRYRAKVDLIYIDPPFMVNSDFRADNTIEIEIDEEEGVQAKKEPSLVEHLAYRDTWRQGLDSFLSMLKRRLELLKELLAPTGTIYVHLDWHAVHYVKVLMDEIFGYENFLNHVTWKRSSAHSDTSQGAKYFGRVSDTLLVYSISDRYFWSNQYVPYDPEYVASDYKRVDERGLRYRISDLTAAKAGGDTSYEFMGVRPYKGRYWAYKRETMEEFLKQGRIVQTKPGLVPQYKNFLHEMPGVPIQDIWSDIALNNRSKEVLGYPTQKPLALLERVIATSCPPGGLVLDCFIGSGTTAEASERLGRRWIGIDNGKYGVHLTRKRLIQLHGQPKPPEKSQAEYAECATCKNVARKEKPQKTREVYNVSPFTVENMGVYQRAEQWQDFQSQKSKYRDEMIKVFGGEPGGVGQHLHGRKESQWVHVGPLDGAVSSAQIWSIAREAARTDTKAVTVLSADFDTLSAGEKDAIKQKTGVQITIRVIPISAIDEVRRRIEMMRVGGERAVESMAIPAFYAPLSIVLAVATTGRVARVTLDRCEIDIQSFLQSQRPALKAVTDGMSATARKKAVAERDKWASREKELNTWLRKADTWQKFIDFWAIDWDYGHRVGADEKPIFETEWQSFRLRKSKGEVEALTFTAEFKYAEAGQYRIAARVTDVFGNDGIATVSCEVT